MRKYSLRTGVITYLFPLTFSLLITVSILTGEGSGRMVNAHDTSLLVLLCLILAAGIVSRRYFHKLKRRTHKVLEDNKRLELQQEALLQLVSSSRVFSGSPSAAAIEITESAANSLCAARTSIWLLDESGRSLQCLDLFDRSIDRHYCLLPVSREETPEFFEAISHHHRVISFRGEELEKLGVPLIPPRPSTVLYGAIHAEGILAGFVCAVRYGSKIEWAADEQNFLGSIADVMSMVIQSEKKRSVERELKLKSLAIESAMDGIAILNRCERFEFVNHAFARTYGYTDPSELIGKTWKLLYRQVELRRFDAHLMPRFRAHGQMNVEAEGKRKDGSSFPQEISLTRLENGGTISVVRDITIRKKVERRAEKVALFATLNPSPMMRFSSRGEILMANPAAIQIFSLSTSHSQYLQTLIPEIDRDDLEKCIRAGDIRRLVVSYEGKQYQFVLRGIPHLHAGHIYGTDITEQKMLHEQLVQSQKMEAIGQLAGGIAHDFNNILTGIMGYTSLLRDENCTASDIVSNAERIEDAATRASELTQQLLGFARKGKHRSVPVDFHSTIEDCFRLLDSSIEKSISIEKRLSAQYYHVLGDPTQLQQVVINLALNARDALISSERTCAQPPALSVTTDFIRVGGSGGVFVQNVKAGRYLCLTMQDNGCGMSEFTQQRIFEPFFTTKEKSKGTGMGLAMVYGIVRSHDGAIEFESDTDLGTEFRVYLPVTEEKPTHTVHKKLVARSGKGRILLVDDHRMIRDATSRMLETLGYQVRVAEDGVEAVRIYEEHWTSIDLVILDMIMPRMGAKECFHRIRDINPEVRAILSTGYENNHAVQEIMDQGMLAFVQKPYQLSKLSEVVSSSLSNNPDRQTRHHIQIPQGV